MNHFVIGHRLLFAVCRTAARWEGFICARGTEHEKKIDPRKPGLFINSFHHEKWFLENRETQKRKKLGTSSTYCINMHVNVVSGWNINPGSTW